jgi:DNA-binding HxlR family transcriptional regulator
MQNIEFVQGMQNHCNCPIEATLNVIGGKWKPMILCLLANDTLRYNKIQQLMPEVSPKMLTKQLRELEYDGLILRKMYPEIPPKVEYSITDFGRTVLPVLKTLLDWGAEYLGKQCIATTQINTDY